MLDINDMKKNDVDIVNYISIKLLEQFYVYRPTERQIEAMESFILTVICGGKLIDEKLTRIQIQCLIGLLEENRLWYMQCLKV